MIPGRRRRRLRDGTSLPRQRRPLHVSHRITFPIRRGFMAKSVEDKVKEIIIEQLGVEEDDVTPAAKFIEDLGADSLDTVEDRKSTRLNSSHVKISYAVFCLKKKKHHSLAIL